MVTKLKELQTAKKTFWYLVFAIVAGVILYAYLVNKTVYNVAEREKIESEISALTSTLGELEFKYISMRNTINPEYARSLGFQDLKSQEFISLKTELNGLSLKNF